MSHGPIPDEYRAKMNALAEELDDVLNGDIRPKKVGFALLMFPFGENPQGSRINYIGNADRADVLVALKELVARWEGRVVESESKQ